MAKFSCKNCYSAFVVDIKNAQEALNVLCPQCQSSWVVYIVDEASSVKQDSQKAKQVLID